jgi:hypothetical protein
MLASQVPDPPAPDGLQVRYAAGAGDRRIGDRRLRIYELRSVLARGYGTSCGQLIEYPKRLFAPVLHLFAAKEI